MGEKSPRGRTGWATALFAMALTGCTTTTVKNVRTVSDRTETRQVSEDGEPPLTATWRFEDGALVGELRSGSCIRREAWTVTEQRVTEVEANVGAGVICLVGGLLLFSAAAAQEDDEYGCVAGVCKTEPSAMEHMLWIGGVVVGSFGLTTLVWSKNAAKKQIQPLRSRREGRRSKQACVTRHELLGMKLAVKLAGNKGVVGTVDGDGHVRIPLPRWATLKAGEELPIVVVRPPLGSQLFRRGSVLMNVVVPAEGASPIGGPD